MSIEEERQARFERFVSLKTAEAARAHLDPLVTEIDEAPGSLAKVGNTWTRKLFDGAFYESPALNPGRPACSLSFVQSKDGNTGADEPFTLGGGLTDKHLLYEGLSQVAADGVLTGSATIRDSEILFGVWHPELVRLRAELGKPRFPVQIVATLSGLDLDKCLLFNVPDVPVLVITVASGVRALGNALTARPWVRTIVMSEREDLPAAFDALRSLGIARVTGVGGRHLASQLIDAKLVQDIYLTTSARPGGQPGTPMYTGLLRARTLVRKHGTGEDTGVRFEHLQLEDRQ